jgi:aspartyl-tRNA synthetase
MAWVESVEEVMGFEERMLTHVLEKVSEKHGARISELFGVDVVVPEVPFPRISMSEALTQLRTTGWDPAGVREDLNAEGERLFGEWVLSEFGHQFVFLTDFPVSVRPFYHMLTKEDPSTTASFDLLWKGVEITTGAQREHRYNVLIEQAAGKGLSPEPMSSYLNVFRHGCPPHGGFGLGLARLLMLMLGLPGINESTFLFRGPNRLEP